MKDGETAVGDGAGTPPGTLRTSELLTLSMQLNSRIDTLWQRVIYAHGLMVGVLVFLAQADHPFTVPRLLVVFFYTMNTLVTFVAFQDAYHGLRAVLTDIRARDKGGSAVHGWVARQDYSTHTLRRALILSALWAIITYLLVYPIFGLGPLMV